MYGVIPKGLPKVLALFFAAFNLRSAIGHGLGPNLGLRVQCTWFDGTWPHEHVGDTSGLMLPLVTPSGPGMLR